MKVATANASSNQEKPQLLIQRVC